MRSKRRSTLLWVLALALCVLGSARIAASLKLREMMPRLAADYTLARDERSPGKVTFSHA